VDSTIGCNSGWFRSANTTGAILVPSGRVPMATTTFFMRLNLTEDARVLNLTDNAQDDEKGFLKQ
jgi:hypothetical protein